ncbi:MAG TPA: hypothetical protein VFA98_15610 [Thermoanaerobaculia bacterium]|nr:hypothetical protein [Thermoanaerobaculia bacterium]
MRKTIGFLAGALAAAAASMSCGSPAPESHHLAEKATPAPAPPTPDTTPFESLRTPAGLVIRLDAPTPTPVVPK